MIVKCSAARCRLCRKRWREAFPGIPDGCYFSGQENESFVYFNLETGWPNPCMGPEPDAVNPTAQAVLEVLDYCRGQLTGEGASVDIKTALRVAELRGLRTDGFFLELWAVACGEWMAMRSEMIKEATSRDEPVGG